jgi:hypothetical protein
LTTAGVDPLTSAARRTSPTGVDAHDQRGGGAEASDLGEADGGSAEGQLDAVHPVGVLASRYPSSSEGSCALLIVNNTPWSLTARCGV